MIADKIPIFKEDASETVPTIPLPLMQPMSPPRASRANIAVPPAGLLSAARLNTPGHIIATESPQSAQPISESSPMLSVNNPGTEAKR